MGGNTTGLPDALVWEILVVQILFFFILNLVFSFPVFKHLLNTVNSLGGTISKPRQMKTRAECHLDFLLHQIQYVRKLGEGGQE